MESSQTMALDPNLSVDASGDPRSPLMEPTGIDLQIRQRHGQDRFH
jgi:hypothetical protein